MNAFTNANMFLLSIRTYKIEHYGSCIVQSYSYSSFGETKVYGQNENEITSSQMIQSDDPSEFDGGDNNLYRYVKNNPMKYTDPTGKGPLGGTACITYVRNEAMKATKQVDMNEAQAKNAIEKEIQRLLEQNLKKGYVATCSEEERDNIDVNKNNERITELGKEFEKVTENARLKRNDIKFLYGIGMAACVGIGITPGI